MNERAQVAGVPARVPRGSVVERVTFVTEPSNGQTVLMEFPDPINRRAVLVNGAFTAVKDRPPAPAEEVLVLSVPAPTRRTRTCWSRCGSGWIQASRRRPQEPDDRASRAQIVWAPGRVAVLAQGDRLDSVRKALIEVSYYEAELRSLERELSGLWPDLEADAPLAFEFEEKSIRKRRHLSQRFQQILSLRARLARITPHVLHPHVHPPTLASQVGERIRERIRMTQRVEFIDGQIEVFERIYESCGQRASDFMLARRSHTLEWVIILLLLTQTILLSVDLMSKVGK